MLSRARRVSTRLFNDIMEHGTTYHAPTVYMKVLARPEEPTRCTVVVSKKIDKRATKRNWLKRRIFTHIQALLPRVQPGYAAIFFIKKSTSRTHVADYTHDIDLVVPKALIQ